MLKLHGRIVHQGLRSIVFEVFEDSTATENKFLKRVLNQRAQLEYGRVL